MPRPADDLRDTYRTSTVPTGTACLLLAAGALIGAGILLLLAPTVKAIEDGLVDAGVVPDDDPRYVQPTPAVIDPPTTHLPRSLGGRRLYLIVREVEPLTQISDAAAAAILDLAALDAELRGHQPKQWSPW